MQLSMKDLAINSTVDQKGKERSQRAKPWSHGPKQLDDDKAAWNREGGRYSTLFL